MSLINQLFERKFNIEDRVEYLESIERPGQMVTARIKKLKDELDRLKRHIDHTETYYNNPLNNTIDN